VEKSAAGNNALVVAYRAGRNSPLPRINPFAHEWATMRHHAENKRSPEAIQRRMDEDMVETTAKETLEGGNDGESVHKTHAEVTYPGCCVCECPHKAAECPNRAGTAATQTDNYQHNEFIGGIRNNLGTGLLANVGKSAGTTVNPAQQPKDRQQDGECWADDSGEIESMKEDLTGLKDKKPAADG